MQKQKLTNLAKHLFTVWRNLPQSSPQRWFVVVALVFGAAFAILTPVYDPPDEFGHLARAYGLSHGQVIPQTFQGYPGAFVPHGFTAIGTLARDTYYSLNSLTDLTRVPLDSHTQDFRAFPNLVLYSPLVYTPHIVGLGVGEILQLPPFPTLILARLCNLIAYVLLFYWAIRLLPFGKWFAVVIGLLPMHIILAGSMSSDPISTGLIALTVATVLYFRDQRAALTRRHILLLCCLAATLSLTKLPYPLLLCMFLLLPVRSFGSGKRRWKYLGLAALTAGIVGGGWLLFAKSGIISYGPAGVDAGAQISLLLREPWHFIQALITSFFTPASDSFTQNYIIGIGPVLAWLPIWMSYAYSSFLILSLWGVKSTSRAVLSGAQKFLLGCLGTSIVLIILLLLYISWTPVGALTIEGIQARYLTPLLLLLIPLMTSYDKREVATLKPRWYRYVPLLFLFASLFAAFHYFYTMKVVIPF